jgi:hypothetical protein
MVENRPFERLEQPAYFLVYLALCMFQRLQNQRLPT